MPAVRHLSIDEPSALYAPSLGAVVVYVSAALHHHQLRLAGGGHDQRANFLRWTLRGRLVTCAVLHNVEPGRYLAEWVYGRLALDVIVFPRQVTRVDWREMAWFGRGSGYDRMVPPAAIVLPRAPARLPAAKGA
jgi:hypothetical protein